MWDIRELEDDRLKQFKENEVNGWRFLPDAFSQLSQRLKRPLQQEEVCLFQRPDHLYGAKDLAADHGVAGVQEGGLDDLKGREVFNR